MTTAVSADVSPRISVVPPAPTSIAPAAVEAPPRSSRKRLLVGALAAVALAGAGTYVVLQRGIESTDDAQVDADVVAVPARIGGTVTRVFFTENAHVKAGDVLAELDAAPARARLLQAEANLAAAMAVSEAADADAEVSGASAVENRVIAAANLQNSTASKRASEDQIREGEALVQAARTRLAQAELDAARARSLASSGASTRAALENADTARDVASTDLAAQIARLSTLRSSATQSVSRVAEASAKLRINDHVDTLVKQAHARAANAHAQVETARAARELAALDVAYTQVKAPRDGVVSKKSINEGQAVAMGQTVVQLVPEERWVTANFKETQLAHMHEGQLAHFEVDAYPGIDFEGRVQSFSGATGSRFTLLPPDNASGNYTKVVQRVPVRIQLEHPPSGLTLRPGMSVTLDVDTREKG